MKIVTPGMILILVGWGQDLAPDPSASGPESAFWEALAATGHDPSTVECNTVGCGGTEEHYALAGEENEWDGGTHGMNDCRDKVCDCMNPGHGKRPWCGDSETNEEEQLLLLEAFLRTDPTSWLASDPAQTGRARNWSRPSSGSRPLSCAWRVTETSSTPSGSSTEINVFSPEGDWVRSIRAPSVDTRLGPERIGAFRAWMLGRLELNLHPPERWAVFDREGRFLSAVIVPPDFTLMAATEDRVFGRWRDEMDVQYVAAYRIERP